jgi:hypothetical protein
VLLEIAVPVPVCPPHILHRYLGLNRDVLRGKPFSNRLALWLSNAFVLIVLGCRRLRCEQSGFKSARTAAVRVSSTFRLDRPVCGNSWLSPLLVPCCTYFRTHFGFCDFLGILFIVLACVVLEIAISEGMGLHISLCFWVFLRLVVTGIVYDPLVRGVSEVAP